MRLKSQVVGFFVVAAALPLTQGQQKRPVTPSDCVSVRYLRSGFHPSIIFNLQRTSVAYLVTAPNLATNQNETELYVKDVSDVGADPSKLILTADDISQIHWLDDGKHIVALLKRNSETTISEININTGRTSVLVRDRRGIDEYDIGRDASVIAYSIVDDAKAPNIIPDHDQVAQGYRISDRRPTASLFPQHKVYSTRKRKNGLWSDPVPVILASPFTGRPLSIFPAVSSLKLSLSPNGELLLLTFLTGEPLPPSWQRSPYVHKMMVGIGFNISVTILQDLLTGKTTIPLASPEPWNLPLWSRDSKSYLAVTAPPVDSRLEEQDYQRNPTSYGPGHLFHVEVASGKIEEVTSRIVNIGEQPLSWKEDGEILVHTGPNTIGTFRFVEGSWREVASVTIPLPNRFQYGQLAGDGSRIVGDYQSTTTAPELFLYSSLNNKLLTIAPLNPQLEQVTLGAGREIHWKTTTGRDIDGLLLLPPDYVTGKRYPLVIQTKPEYGQFLCDAGQEYYPSFAPQPIVNVGMLYLIRSLSSADSDREDANYFPKGYPGQIGEAAFHMDIWDSAVEMLDGQGLIDPDEVGIIGFSRAGWYTEFMLAHAKTHYRAATVADNVQYSLGEYWLAHSDWILRGFESMYGGSPYGSAQKNWVQYSISYNLDKIHAPLLMEEMGNGIPYSSEKAPPLNLALSFEVFIGLKQQAKPAELFYYQNEPHQLIHPQARLASLQRNLDWYKHWLLEEPLPVHTK
jgi:dipeptidyl aminopeptidase/acylaminoacyl peptidase